MRWCIPHIMNKNAKLSIVINSQMAEFEDCLIEILRTWACSEQANLHLLQRDRVENAFSKIDRAISAHMHINYSFNQFQNQLNTG